MRVSRQFDKADARGRAMTWWAASTRRRGGVVYGFGSTAHRARVDLARQVYLVGRPATMAGGRLFWERYAREHPDSIVTRLEDGAFRVSPREAE